MVYDKNMNDTMNMQLLTAKRAGDHNGHPTWDVFSDELGLVGNYFGYYACDAIAEAREDLL